MKKFKRHKDYGFWDQDIRMSKLSQLGDPLERLNCGVDFEKFREVLEARLSKQAKGSGGHPPYGYVLIFKILILQRYYDISDYQTEFQINDYLSFMRFLDLTIADDIPDSKMVWAFRKVITDLGLAEELFELFQKELNVLGLVVNEGKIVDASFVEVLRRRNSRDENKQIKEGKTSDLFKDIPNKLSQKDTDARWAKKNDMIVFGYKNHVKQDVKSKLITNYEVADASVLHDSQVTNQYSNLIMCRIIILIFIFRMFTTLSFSQQDEIKLYPNDSSEDNKFTESLRNNEYLFNISYARMYPYIVSKEKAVGSAVLICPGGGYSVLSVIKEGEEVAKWFNNLGVSAFVLYYRMPNGNKNIPIKDAQTAMEIVHENAKKWNIDENKIGIIGFSAGGHLASTVGTHFNSKTNRPAFMILVYPVISMKSEISNAPSIKNLLGDNPSQADINLYSNETQITKDTPPTFIVHAKDDNVVPVEGSKVFYRELIKNNISSELKIYENGGHGFIMRKHNVDSDAWMQELRNWLKSENLL